MTRTNVRHGVRLLPKKQPSIASTAMRVTSGTARLVGSVISFQGSVQDNSGVLFDIQQSMERLSNCTYSYEFQVEKGQIEKLIEIIGKPPAPSAYQKDQHNYA